MSFQSLIRKLKIWLNIALFSVIFGIPFLPKSFPDWKYVTLSIPRPTKAFDMHY